MEPFTHIDQILTSEDPIAECLAYVRRLQGELITLSAECGKEQRERDEAVALLHSIPLEHVDSFVLAAWIEKRNSFLQRIAPAQEG